MVGTCSGLQRAGPSLFTSAHLSLPRSPPPLTVRTPPARRPRPITSSPSASPPRRDPFARPNEKAPPACGRHLDTSRSTRSRPRRASRASLSALILAIHVLDRFRQRVGPRFQSRRHRRAVVRDALDDLLERLLPEHNGQLRRLRRRQNTTALRSRTNSVTRGNGQPQFRLSHHQWCRPVATISGLVFVVIEDRPHALQQLFRLEQSATQQDLDLARG